MLLDRLKRIGLLREILRPPARAVKSAIHRRRLAAYRKLPVTREKDPRILIAMNAGVGNAVEATPLVQATRALWPGAELTLYEPPGDLFDDWCVVDNYIRLPRSSPAGNTTTHSCRTPPRHRLSGPGFASAAFTWSRRYALP